MRVNIYLNEYQLTQIDTQAEKEGISRSAMIQKAMQTYLDSLEGKESITLKQILDEIQRLWF